MFTKLSIKRSASMPSKSSTTPTATSSLMRATSTNADENDVPWRRIVQPPMVGFKLVLNLEGTASISSSSSSSSSSTIPQFQLVLLGARNLPTTLNGANIKACRVKVKQLPESNEFETPVKQGVDFTANESFPLVLRTDQRAQIDVWRKRQHVNVNDLIKQFGGGGSVTLSVIGYQNFAFARSLQEKSEKPSGGIASKSTQLVMKIFKSSDQIKQEDPKSLTSCSTQTTTIGSVNYTLERVPFKETSNKKQFVTHDIWLPLNVLSKEELSKNFKNKIEVTLQLCPRDKLSSPALFKNKPLCLKISTPKLQCSTRRKEELKAAGFRQICLKTTVWKRGIKSVSWKSEPFEPQLSQQWNPDENPITVPLSRDSLDHMKIRVAIAGVRALGKEQRIEEIFLGPKSPRSSPCLKHHWEQMVEQEGAPITMWHCLD